MFIFNGQDTEISLQLVMAYSSNLQKDKPFEPLHQSPNFTPKK